MPALCKSALFTVPGRQVACVSGREGVKRETDTITIKELSLLLPGKSGSLAGGGGGARLMPTELQGLSRVTRGELT